MDSRVQAVGTVYEFDDVRVEPLSHRMFKAGREVPVEPKVYAALLEFLRRPGQVITHDELLDAIWQHHHVTPAALARVVSQLRKRLDDSPDAPRYIQTVHTVGYRFVAAVTLTQTSGVEAVADPSARAHAETGPVAAPAAAGPAPQSGLRPFRLAPLLASIVALVAIAAAGLQAWRAGAPPAARARASVAVLPLAVPAGDEDLRAAATGFADSMIETLSQVPTLRVGGRASALAIGAAAAADPERTAQALGVDNLVFGNVAARDSELAVRLELWRRDRPAPQVLLDQTLPRTQLFRALTRAADGVQAALTGAGVQGSGDAILPARDLYLLGRAQWQEHTQSSLQRALDYFRRAVAADPSYALAWCGLADTYSRLQPGAMSEAQLLDNARSALAQARLLAPEAADTFVSEGLLLERQPGQRAGALLAFKRALERNPHHPLALLRYANSLRYVGRARDAIEWHQRALEFDPLNVRLHNELASDYISVGNDVLAHREIARVLELEPGNTDALGRVGYLQARSGRLADAARAFAEKIERKPLPEPWEYFDLARVYLQAGAVDLAERVLSMSPDADSAESLYELAGVRIAQGRQAEALALFSARCPPPRDVELCSDQLARLLALLGRRDEARALYDSLFSDALRSGDQPSAFWNEEFYWHHFAAWLALLPADSAERRRGVAYWGSQIQRMEDNGARCPGASYQRASHAALSGDADAARRQLDAAIASGWLDVAALDRDLEWQPYAQEAWMHAARDRIAALAAVERARMPAGFEKLSAR